MDEFLVTANIFVPFNKQSITGLKKTSFYELYTNVDKFGRRIERDTG